MVQYMWDEKLCRQYADGLRPMVRFDHGRWAQRIAGELGDLPAGATLVDVATGPGFLLIEIGKLLPGLELVGLDQAAPMMHIAAEEAAAAGLTLQTGCCPAEALALPDGAADVVTCKQLLHEAGDVDAVLREACRILKPGGRLFVIDFDPDGSTMAAVAVRSLLTLTRGRLIGRSFWRSFRDGEPGAQVRQRVLDAGFESAEYQRSGFNYFITGTKGS
jgi:ubiquinone/menaquinone biosynthesis C-methylase UbiE